MPIIILVATISFIIWMVLRQWAKTASDADKKYLRRLTLWTFSSIGLLILIVTGRFFHAIGWAFMILMAVLIASTLSKRRRINHLRLSNQSKNFSGPLSIQKAYEVLGLEADASRKDIQAAYIELIKIHHPDNGGTENMSALLNEAYDMLMDPNRHSHTHKDDSADSHESDD